MTSGGDGNDIPIAVASDPWVHEPGSERSVALEVLLRGPIARAEIAQRLGLSAGSVTRLTKPLLDAGLVVETEARMIGQTGRPSLPLEIVPQARHFIGMKVTDHDVTAVLTDLKAQVLRSVTIPLAGTEPLEVLEGAVAAVAALGDGEPASVSSLGVGLGGLVSGHRVVREAPFLGWSDVEFAAMIEDALGIPTTVENDVIAFTAYENWFGAGRRVDRFALITLGAGVGYGAVVNGELLIDEDSGLGLVGHWPIDPHGPVCPAGHRGCARSVLTSEAIARNVEAATGSNVDLAGALQLAETEPAARRIIDEAAAGLGSLIAAIENLLAPELVVIGGEGVHLAEVARMSLDTSIRSHRHPQARTVPLVMAGGGDVEWARGAAVVAMRSYVLAGR